MKTSHLAVVLLLLGAPRVASAQDTVERASVEHLLRVLADDSMQGRRTGTPGIRRAARFLADEMARIGLEPGGDDGYLQTVPLAPFTRQGGRPGYRVLLTQAARDSVPADSVVLDANVVGLIRGSDPTLAGEAVVVGAHYDHIGIGQPVDGDSINNGADDDASGTVAVLEVARALQRGAPPKRTVIFVAFTGEEMGLLGTRYYIENPVISMENTVAELQIEMIGRPDDLAGGEGKAWLTGYERSTMGDMLRDNGIAIVPDPRPDQNFFMRSDNIAFARIGIPAHTLSSFNLHTDYHRPSDDVDKVDFAHMTAVIEATVQAVRHLADGEKPRWHPGGRPGA